MTANHEVAEAALAFATTLGLGQCTVKSVEQYGSDWWVLVEGTLTLKSLPVDEKDKKEVAAFLSEPFCVKVLVSRGTVLKHEWLGIQLS